MSSITTFMQRVPSDILQSYFAKTALISIHDIDWSIEPPRQLAARVTKLIEQIPESGLARLRNDVERISEMSTDAGQAALLGVTLDHSHLNKLPNRHARAAFVFVNDPTGFRRAEEAQSSDERRKGRHWSGYEAESDLTLRASMDALQEFKDAVRHFYKARNVHVDLFERRKTTYENENLLIIQATIYRDGLPDDVAEFQDGELGWSLRRPVYEAAVTYEPKGGRVEVVAPDKGSHSVLASLFAQLLLGTQSGDRPLPLREYDLDVLLRPFPFPTDAGDGIESVHVTQLRLSGLDIEGERLTLECARLSPHNIWDMSQQRFGGYDPLMGGWIPTQAKLVIRFRPTPEARRGKTLPFNIAMPNGCNLKDRTVHENLIGFKYLERWGLIKNVAG